MIKIVQLFVLLFVPKTLNALYENNNNSQHVTPYGPILAVLTQSFLTQKNFLECFAKSQGWNCVF